MILPCAWSMRVEIDLDLLYDDKRTKTQVTTNDLGSVYSADS